MIAGIVIQLVSMSIFSMLLFYTMYSARSYWLTGPNLASDAGKMKLVLGATLTVDACILARNYYRAVELGQGWQGNLMVHEAYFCVFDAALMVLVVGAYAFFPPQLMIKKDIKVPDAFSTDKVLSDSDVESGEKKPAQQEQQYGNFQTQLNNDSPRY